MSAILPAIWDKRSGFGKTSRQTSVVNVSFKILMYANINILCIYIFSVPYFWTCNNFIMDRIYSNSFPFRILSRPDLPYDTILSRRESTYNFSFTYTFQLLQDFVIYLFEYYQMCLLLIELFNIQNQRRPTALRPHSRMQRGVKGNYRDQIYHECRKRIA